MKSLILFSALAAQLLLADSGKKTYEMFCAGCHGMDGQGVEGAAPPLAGSDWVQGDANIMVQILTHGLQGEIKVKNKSYNLVMPPQVALNDAQMVDVINYVRSSWGNKEEAISADFLNKSKEKHAQQSGMWDAKELLKAYPLENAPVPIEHLIANFYRVKSVSKSQFNTQSTSDLHKRTPAAVEEESDGLISPSQGDSPKKTFGMIWEGKLPAAKAGTYTFEFTTDHVAQININGHEVLTRSASKGDKSRKLTPTLGQVELPEGKFDIEIRYIHLARTPSVCELFWSGPGFTKRPLHIINSNTKSSDPEIKVLANTRPVVMRSFFTNSSPRTLAVGFPEKLNCTFDVRNLKLGYLWRGDFVDAAPIWTGRGKKDATPLTKALHHLNKGATYYVSHGQKNSPAGGDLLNFVGHDLDKDGYPTLRYTVGSYQVSDTITPAQDGNQLTRNITYQLTGNPQQIPQVLFRVFDENNAAKGTREFQISKQASLSLVSDHRITTSKDGVFIALSPESKSQTISLTYNFN